MTEPQTPDTDAAAGAADTIIELVDKVNPWLLVGAFVVGAVIVMAAVAWLGRERDE